MTNIINEVEGFISGNMLNQAATNLGESKGDLSTAMSLAIPSILSGLLNKSSNIETMASFFNMAKSQEQNSEVLNNPNELFTAQNIIARGKELVNSLFETKKYKLENTLSESSGIKSTSATRLLVMTGPLVMSYFGRKIKLNAWGVSEMVDYLQSQKSNIKEATPSRIDTIISKDGEERNVQEELNEGPSPMSKAHLKSKNKIKYIMYAVVGIFFLFIISRSCTRNANENEVKPFKDTKSSNGGGNNLLYKISIPSNGMYEILI